jgi:hypothetical protein
LIRCIRAVLKNSPCPRAKFVTFTQSLLKHLDLPTELARCIGTRDARRTLATLGLELNSPPEWQDALGDWTERIQTAKATTRHERGGLRMGVHYARTRDEVAGEVKLRVWAPLGTLCASGSGLGADWSYFRGRYCVDDLLAASSDPCWGALPSVLAPPASAPPAALPQPVPEPAVPGPPPAEVPSSDDSSESGSESSPSPGPVPRQESDHPQLAQDSAQLEGLTWFTQPSGKSTHLSRRGPSSAPLCRSGPRASPFARPPARHGESVSVANSPYDLCPGCLDHLDSASSAAILRYKASL